MGLQLRPLMAQLQEPTQSSGDEKWDELARSHWLKDTKVRKVKPESLKKICDLLARASFGIRPLLTLESLQILEKYKIHPCIPSQSN